MPVVGFINSSWKPPLSSALPDSATSVFSSLLKVPLPGGTSDFKKFNETFSGLENAVRQMGSTAEAYRSMVAASSTSLETRSAWASLFSACGNSLTMVRMAREAVRDEPLAMPHTERRANLVQRLTDAEKQLSKVIANEATHLPPAIVRGLASAL